MLPDELIKTRAKKVVDNGTGPFAVPLAQLTESILINENLEKLADEIRKIEIPKAQEIEIPEFPTEISVSNLPEVQKVEVLNFPEQKAPIVNIEASKAPIVNVEAPIVELNNEEVVAELKNISNLLSKEEIETIEQTEIVDKEGKPVDFKELFNKLSNSISNIKVGGIGFSAEISRSLDELRAVYSSRVDTLSSPGIIYTGSAPTASAESASVWKISKIDTTGSPVDVKITWADGNANFDNVWNDRTSLTYS